MVVDKIVDVVEEAVTGRQQSNRKGLVGSAVVGKRVTDFIDLQEVIHASEGIGVQVPDTHAGRKRILVVDASAFSRGMIRCGLDMAGYDVVEAENLKGAMEKLERQSIDLVAVALDLPPAGGPALLASIRSRSEWSRIPVMALADSIEQTQAFCARTVGFEDCQTKFDSSLILESVARLVLPEASNEPELACVGEKG